MPAFGKTQAYERRGGVPVPFMGMLLPAVQHNHKKTMYGEIVALYEIAVHFSWF